jgi:hypothetical protein
VRGPHASLVVGERVVSYCDDGLLEVEYALFDQDDVTVSASLGFGAREQGYSTTAKRARERLRAGGITPELVSDTFAAVRGPKLCDLARAPVVRLVLDHLTACEAFEGGAFSARTRTYAGVWLDLRALATACPLAGAAHLLQALHLASVLDDVADDSPVRLLTAALTAGRRPGARTWSRVRFEGTSRLAWVLNAMQTVSRTAQLDEVAPEQNDVRGELLANLRARTSVSLERARLYAIAEVLSRAQHVTPAYGTPFASACAASATESATTALDKTPLPRPAPETEPTSADDPRLAFDELGVHAEMLKVDAHLHDVARLLSAMSDGSATPPELAVLAARAWLAAGHPARARSLAKKVMRCRGAPSHIRLDAIDILRSTLPKREAVALPVPAAASERATSAPPLSPPPSQPAPPRGPAAPPGRVPPPLPRRRPPSARVPSPLPPSPMRFRPDPSELVESLSLPQSANEDMLREGARPREPLHARIAMTRLARSLGRDYRLWYGTILKTDAIAIDAMQRHLRRAFDGACDPRLARHIEADLTRHGALLSELLARGLGGVWVDVRSELPGQWAMSVPPDLRVWPLERVYRFFRQGHREADLVAFYLELEARRMATRGGHPI